MLTVTGEMLQKGFAAVYARALHNMESYSGLGWDL